MFIWRELGGTGTGVYFSLHTVILSFKKYNGAVRDLLFNISLGEGQSLKVDKSRAQSENDIISTDD